MNVSDVLRCLCKLGDCLFVVFQGQKQCFDVSQLALDHVLSASFPCVPTLYTMLTSQNRVYVIKLRKGCNLYWLKILHYILDV